MKKTILLIDKDMGSLEAFSKRLLLESDVEVKYSTINGCDASANFQASPSEIVIMNMPLSDCDSFQLVSYLKSIKNDVVIVAVLDTDNQMVRNQLQSLGINDIYVKPYNMEQIVEGLKSIARKLNSLNTETTTTQPFGMGQFGVNPGTQAQPYNNAFGGTQPQQAQNPFEKVQTPSPFEKQGAVSGTTSTPFNTQSSQPSSPFGGSSQPQSSPFSGSVQQQPQSQSPFGQGPQGNSPFNQQQAQPQFSGQQQAPFNQQQQPQQEQYNQPQSNQFNVGGQMGIQQGLGLPDNVAGFKTIKQMSIALNCPKGGVGKTSISTNIATALSTVKIGKQPLKVLLVDLDLEFGDVATTLGMQPHPSIMNWISDINSKLERTPNVIPQYTQAQIEQYLITYKTGLKVLTAPANHSDIMDITDKAVQIVIDNLKANGGFDVIIFDTGNNTSGYTLYAMFGATAVYEVVTLDLSAMNDLNMLLKTLRSLNFPMNKMKLIINRLPKSDKEFSIQDISQALGLEVAGVIPEFSKVRVANNSGEPLVLGKENEFTQHIRMLCNTMLGVNLFTKAKPSSQQRGSSEKKSGGFFSKLFGREK